jgi:5-methylthioadenosine/S-adenosylhomocysteine deaminase
VADLLIKNGYVITMDPERRILERGSVVIEGGRIKMVGRGVDEPAEVVIDAQGKAVLPGLVNAHTHLAMTLLRGIADDMQLMPWLQEVVWPTERHLTGRHCYTGALLGCLEMIKSGTTCFADQYFFMEDVARAVEESGLRAALSYGIIEQGNPKKRATELDAGEALVKSCQGMANGRITTMFGPHAPYTCSPECLMQIKERARKHGVGIHIHLAETKANVEEISGKYGKRPVEHLNAIGFLGPEVLAAHCVWLTGEEMGIIRGSGTKPVHNPVSNMKLGSGVAPVKEMLEIGIPVALGTDGAASNNSLDMFSEMKFAALLSKIHNLDPTAVPAQAALEMATINGATALGLRDEIGSLEEGKKADLVLVDLRKPHLTPRHDVVSHLVYSATGSDVNTVVVDGEPIMRGRKVLTLNEDEVLERSQRTAEDLLTRRMAR